MTKKSTLARVGALLFFTDVIQRCSALLVKREYFDDLYCFFYLSISTVWVFADSLRVFCRRTLVKSQFLCLYFRLCEKQLSKLTEDLAGEMASSAKPK